MKKIFSFSLLGFFLLSFLVSTGFGQNTQNILNRMIDATGGRKTLEDIKDTMFSGAMEIVQFGMSATITFYHKEPNKLRQDVELTEIGMVITTASDGNVAWILNSQTGTVEDMPGSAGEELKNQAVNFGFSWMLNPEKYGISFADKGNETIDGKDYLVLEQTAPGDFKTTYYIDPETYLVYKSKTMITDPQTGFQVEQESISEDYRKVEGIMFAHSIILYQNGEEFGSMIVEALKFNSGLEDSLFKK
jgi:outer membrane lipoprotein-sorting protein